MGLTSTTRLVAFAMAGMFAAGPVAIAAAQDKPALDTGARTTVQELPTDPAARRQAAYKRYLEGEQFERAGDYIRAVEAYKQTVELVPEDDQPRVALARLYLSNRNTDAARTAAQDALKFKKDSVPARAVLAEIYVMEAFTGGGVDQAKARSAIGELEEIVKIDERADIQLGRNSVKALATLGQLYRSVDEDKKAIEAFERLSRLDGVTTDSMLALARLYLDQRKFRDAARAAEQARKLDSTNVDALLILGQSLLRTGRAAEAVDAFRQLRVATEAAPPAARNALTIEFADALMQAGRYQEAIEAAKGVLAVEPRNVRAIRVLSDAERRSGKREQAVKTLESALVGQDVSESLELVFALAETFEELERYDRAIETYEEAFVVLVNPDGTVAANDRNNASVILRRIATAHRFAGRPEKVTETYDRMRKVLGPDDSMADILQVQEAIELTRYEDAVARARKAAVTAKGDDKRTFAFLEAQALSKKGDAAEAVKIIQGHLTGGSEDSDVYAFMSVIQLDGGDATGAEKSIRKALQAEPNDTGLLITLSSIQDRAGQYGESEKTLRQVLELDPDNSTALNNLGYFLTERNERLEEALGLIQRAVNIDPTNGSFLDSLGWLYFQMGKLTEAKKYLEQAAIYEHQSSTIREHLGDLYEKLGDKAKAKQYWEAALKLSNEKPEQERLRGKVK